MNAWQFVMVAVLSDKKLRDSIFILYSPIFFFYSLYLRAARATAYTIEFFRKPYLRDGYFPEQVWDSIPKY